MTDSFESSDSVRSGRTLKYAQYITFDEVLHLEHGGELPQVTVAYETYGKLNANRDNAVLVCHALSGDSHVARHEEDDDPGWWDFYVGPGKPIDTDRYFVICPNILGGCRGTTGPNSIDQRTGRPYGADFPVVTIADIVAVQAKLIDHLHIYQLLAVVGGSLGGHMALWWATYLPDRIKGTIAIATSPRLTSQSLAFDVVARNAIIRDPNYHAGQYYDHGPGPQTGLAIARMLGHITYLSREAMIEKFDSDRFNPRDIRTEFETRFSVGSYLAYQGDRFVERFDANSYLTLSMTVDLFNLGATPRELADTLGRSQCRWLIISFSSDWLFPTFQSREIVDTLIHEGKAVSYCNVRSDCGHDAFLLPNELDSYGEMMRLFLVNLDDDTPKTTQWCAAGPEKCCDSAMQNPTSIFHQHHRLDYDSIVELIAPGASVLDLGCGNGELLARLRERGHERIMGIELDQDSIKTSICRGLDVVQADLNQGLSAFGDKQFDFVVLSQTLQAVHDVPRVLSEMLRVGIESIVSFPNLGYHEYRRELVEQGRAPHAGSADGYNWYNTPTVRFLSIADFEELCKQQGYHIHRQVHLDTQAGHRVDEDPNLNADVAIVVIGDSEGNMQ
ncbi:MAG: homoserine O-acetyltransferase [Pirellulales bacterium]|nr:homoserine O-acetyltransferase [Pirellulales bacterium]